MRHAIFTASFIAAAFGGAAFALDEPAAEPVPAMEGLVETNQDKPLGDKLPGEIDPEAVEAKMDMIDTARTASDESKD